MLKPLSRKEVIRKFKALGPVDSLKNVTEEIS